MVTAETPQSTTDRRWTLVWLSICILLAMAVRSHQLGGQSLWWDESLSLHRSQLPLGEILANHINLTDGSTVIASIDNHPPLYFLALAAVRSALGASEFALRYLSLAFGILLIPLLYVVGVRVVGRRAGLLAALFAAVSPMYLWYSQEVRMYTMAPFLGLLSFYGMLRMLDPQDRGRRAWAVVYVLATIAMLVTHYLTFLVLAVELLVIVLAIMRNSRLRQLAWPLALVVLAAAGISLYLVSKVPPPLPQGGFTFVPLTILLRDVFNSFSLGLSVNVDDVIFLDALFVVVAVFGLVSVASRKSRSPVPAGLLLVLYFVLPLTLTYVASFVRPIYMTSRHLIIITPAFFLALGAGLDGLSSRRGLFISVTAVMLAGIVFSSTQYFGDPIYSEDDNRSWGEYLHANVQPGDVVVVDPPHVFELYNYYADLPSPAVGLPALAAISPDALQASLTRLGAQYRNIWLAYSSTPDWGDPDGAVEKWLDRNLTKNLERNFHGYGSIVRVARYATHSPRLNAPPRIQAPATVNLDGRLMFLGYDAINPEAEPGRALGFGLYFRVLRTLAEDLKVSLRLVDDTGLLWAQSDQIIASLQPATQMTPETEVREDVNLVIPPGTPAGTYTVAMVVYSAVTGQPLSPVPPGPPVSLGKAVVIRPLVATSVQALPLTQEAGGQAEGISLLGLNAPASALHPGDALAFDAYWRALARPAADYELVITLVDGNGKEVARHQTPLSAAGAAPSTWRTGDIVRGQYRLALPRELAPGNYTLHFALLDPATGKQYSLQREGVAGLLPGAGQAVLRVPVVERARVLTAPSITHPLDVNLDGKLAVLGYDMSVDPSAQLRPGQAVTLTLYLQALAPMDKAYTVFVHLIDDKERIWGQRDLAAGGDGYPTTLWRPGEIVSTTFSVVVSPQAPPSLLTAVSGLYDPASSVRLPVTGASRPADRFTLFPPERR